MKRLTTPVKAVALAILFLMMAVLLAPVIAQAMASQAAGNASAPSEQAGETGMDVPFLSSLVSTNLYGFYGIKSVSGQEGSYGMEYACTVQGDNFVVKTSSNKHDYRQMYIDGEYQLVDDTAKTIQKGVLKFDYIDSNLTSAISGKVIRSSGDIIDGNQVTRVEIYKDGTVFAYFLNQQGVLVRFYYIYDGNEISLDLERIMVGGACCASFDIPSTYSEL